MYSHRVARPVPEPEARNTASSTSKGRIEAFDHAYPSPSRNVCIAAARGSCAGAATGRMSSRLPITARNDSALIAKQPVSPTVATSTPATAGPRMRAALNAAELSAMPLGRSSRPVRSITNDCRAGRSNVFTMP